MYKISKIYNYFVDYMLPPRCPSCGEMTDNNENFCSNCWKHFNFITQPYCISCGTPLNISISDKMKCGKCLQTKSYYYIFRSLIKFDEYSKKAIHTFKYKDKIILAKIFTKLLYNQYASEFYPIDLITPVPMNRFKRLFRMYNPALLWAS